MEVAGVQLKKDEGKNLERISLLAYFSNLPKAIRRAIGLNYLKLAIIQLVM